MSVLALSAEFPKPYRMAKTRKAKRWDSSYLTAWAPSAFIAQHPVFSLDELRAAYTQMGRDPKAAQNLVAYHLAQRTLWLVRRGLYSHPTWVDPFVLASHLAPDAVIAYDGALAFYGLMPLGHSVHFISARRTPPLVWNEVVFECVRTPRALSLAEEAVSSGQRIRVSSVEQALVDVLDRLDIGRDLREVWSAFQEAPKLDGRRLVQHLKYLGRGPLLTSRLGLFLEAMKSPDHALLEQLHRDGLQTPAYFDRQTPKGSQIISRWNLICPRVLHDLSGKR